MTLLSKLATILGWTFLGAVSAYIIVSVVTFSQMYGVLLLAGYTIPAWITNLLIGGLGTGFLLGMIKVCVVDVIDATRRR